MVLSEWKVQAVAYEKSEAVRVLDRPYPSVLAISDLLWPA